jgi:predicted  nucleic acid-binding Zn-ribbon protein
VETLGKERSDTASQAEALQKTVDQLNVEIEGELEQHRARRTEIAPTIPEDLLSLYEKLRPAKGGVAAAALVDSTCQGCHTRLPSKEAERLRAERGLQRCDNCGRILVVK